MKKKISKDIIDFELERLKSFVMNEDIEDVKLWALERPELINAYGDGFLSPLDLAVDEANLNFEIIELLIDQGADLNQFDPKHGMTSFHLAALHCGARPEVPWVKMFELFMKKGMRINQTTKSGLTVLHLASRSKHLELVQLIIRCGADIQMVDKEGYNALHNAVLYERLENFNYLLSMGVDHTLKTKKKLSMSQYIDNHCSQFNSFSKQAKDLLLAMEERKVLTQVSQLPEPPIEAETIHQDAGSTHKFKSAIPKRL